MIYISSKRISAIMLAIAVVLSCIAVILSLLLNNSSEKVIGNAEPTQKVEYVLKDYNGHIAVFYSNKDTPYEEFDIPTDTFSEYDKNMLKQGIKADTQEEIRQLIEDYTS